MKAARASLATLPAEHNTGGLNLLAQAEFTAHEFVAARDHAERFQLLNPRYSFNPPIAQTIFHCAGVTGCTDRRAYLTSDMSFRRGCK